MRWPQIHCLERFVLNTTDTKTDDDDNGSVVYTSNLTRLVRFNYVAVLAVDPVATAETVAAVGMPPVVSSPLCSPVLTTTRAHSYQSLQLALARQRRQGALLGVAQHLPGLQLPRYCTDDAWAASGLVGLVGEVVVQSWRSVRLHS
ncbi:uncharacterized protein SPSK_03691 [Sporothrix schenckii 1099-18]|uniref:Uncharacterized protein n=1 Tax=Sporothrix schenckii 1099-18 TaxID=1397361 RepID=A0A0F2M1B7_SPOSC|nr:uncharacterized protein SPSK_03691 [Sporothrix schenckii 1099-18]KJR81936.1 hypothetical protein SPSK_03691 [Sporothrix schenckii 1099-18]